MAGRKISRFRGESMIMHLLDNGRPKITARKIYRASEEFNNLEKFLEKSGFFENYIVEFLKEHGPYAMENYHKIADNYFDRRRDRQDRRYLIIAVIFKYSIDHKPIPPVNPNYCGDLVNRLAAT